MNTYYAPRNQKISNRFAHLWKLVKLFSLGLQIVMTNRLPQNMQRFQVNGHEVVELLNFLHSFDGFDFRDLGEDLPISVDENSSFNHHFRYAVHQMLGGVEFHPFKQCEGCRLPIYPNTQRQHAHCAGEPTELPLDDSYVQLFVNAEAIYRLDD